MATIDQNKASRKARLQVIVAGLQKRFPTGSLILAGQTLTSAQLIALIEQDVSTSDDAVNAYAAWITKVHVERDSHQSLAPVLRALKSLVIAQFGETKDVTSALADFGYTARKITKVTPETKTVAIDKGKATRAARHTMGKKQKAQIKGTVVPTAPAISAPAVSPSATAATAVNPVAAAPASVAANLVTGGSAQATAATVATPHGT